MRRLAADLDATVVDIQRLLAQTGLRLGRVRTIGDRLISLADPDARPIRMGKPQHPTQFGYTALVVEDERGFVADHPTRRGNPSDAGLLVGVVGRVVAVTGRPPGTVVGDRGVWHSRQRQSPGRFGRRPDRAAPLAGRRSALPSAAISA